MSIQAHIFRRKRFKLPGGGCESVSRTWYLRHKRDGGAWSKPINLGVGDKQVAEEKRVEFIRNAEREAAGIVPSRALRAGAAGPLADALKEYTKSIESTRDRMYVYNVGKHVEKLLSECGWKVPRDVSAASFELWRTKQEKKPKTLNDYLAEARGFFKWLNRMGRIDSNPLAEVENLPDKGRESNRRALTPVERDALLSLDSPYRVVYAIALVTGLRRDELAQLLWADVRTEGKKPFLAVAASTTKNGKRAACTLPVAAAELLAASKPGGAKPSDRVFKRLPEMDEFRGDLERAGIDHRPDARGRVVVFHSLRHTLNTDLGRAGVPPAIAMKIMRHSDLKLTMSRYMDGDMLPTDQVVADLAYPIPAPRGTEKGTTDTVNSCPSESGSITSDTHVELGKALVFSGKSAIESPAVHSSPAGGENWGSRIRI